MAIASATTRPKRYALAVELTGYCNQKCGYCYNDWRGDKGESSALPGPELVRILDSALRDVEFDHVTLTGGEPFARPDVWDVLDVVQGHGLRAIIISNGGLIKAATAERLAPYRPHFVQVTLNGPSATLHEEHVGQGHFEATLAGIRALSAAGVNVAGCIVVTRKNAAQVGDTLELFASLGVRSVALSRYSPAGYAAEQIAELLPSRTDLLTALSQAHPFAADRGMSLQVTMPVPPCVVDTSDFPAIAFSSCPIGTEMQEFALGTRGELRNCTLHTESLGDAKTTSMAELVQVPVHAGYRDTTPAFCAPCPMKAQCIGGCGAAAVSVHGARELDPFVGQHVDDALEARLVAARENQGSFVPLGRLKRPRAEIRP